MNEWILQKIIRRNQKSVAFFTWRSPDDGTNCVPFVSFRFFSWQNLWLKKIKNCTWRHNVPTPVEEVVFSASTFFETMRAWMERASTIKRINERQSLFTKKRDSLVLNVWLWGAFVRARFIRDPLLYEVTSERCSSFERVNFWNKRPKARTRGMTGSWSKLIRHSVPFLSIGNPCFPSGLLYFARKKNYCRTTTTIRVTEWWMLCAVNWWMWWKRFVPINFNIHSATRNVLDSYPKETLHESKGWKKNIK